MKIYGKVMMLVVGLLFASTVAFAADDPATAPPDKPHMGGPGMMGGNPGLEVLKDNQAFKDEMTRHQKAMEEALAPIKDLHKKLAEDIKALREEYFPKPTEGQIPVKPSDDKIKEYNDKVKALVDKFQADNEATAKDAAGKVVDEFATHMTNVAKIITDNKAAIVDAAWKKLLEPRPFMGMHKGMRGGMRGGMHPGMGMKGGMKHGEKGPRGPEGPEGPAPEAPAPEPAPAP